MSRGPAPGVLRDAIRADVEMRIERVAAQLEADLPDLVTEDAFARALERVLRRIHGIVAGGLLARLRERARGAS